MKPSTFCSIAMPASLLLIIFLCSSCNLPVDIKRFQLINQTPYEITYYGIASTEAKLNTAENRLDSPLPTHAVAEIDVGRRGQYWLKAIADVEGTPVEHILGPINMTQGIVGWTWNMEEEEIVDGWGRSDRYAQTFLPILVIDTDDEDIPDEPKIPATLHIISNESGDTNKPTLVDATFSSAIAIEQRGNSSQTFPKASWSFELRDEQDDDYDAPLLGMPEEEDWVLYGPWVDRSLIRNVFGYGLWEDMGWYAPRTRFCEVYLHDDSGDPLTDSYHGVYVLTEKIKRDALRVDIAKLEEDVISEPGISGGYLLEMKLPERLDDDEIGLPLADGFVVTLLSPDQDDITPLQTIWIHNHLADFEDALFGVDFLDPIDGYAPYINEDSFIDYMLLQELLKNRDAYHSSTFLYKDRASPIHMGPIWDLNITAGYFSFNGIQKIDGWLFHEDRSNIARCLWPSRLLDDPGFTQRYQDRWAELRATIFSTPTINARIDALAAELNTAQARQFIRWPTLGRTLTPDIRYIMFTGPHPTNYTGEIDYMKQWLQDRAEWIDSNINHL